MAGNSGNIINIQNNGNTRSIDSTPPDNTIGPLGLEVLLRFIAVSTVVINGNNNSSKDVTASDLPQCVLIGVVRMGLCGPC